jgi:hypothetical protein
MTDSKLFDRFIHKVHHQSANENHANEESEIDDLGVFGFLRGSKERAPMLELRKCNGNILAVCYGMFEVEFNPSEGITLNFGDRKVKIGGRNLNSETRPNIKLVEAIARHRVPWIREMSEPEQMKSRGGDTVVEKIEW